MRKKVVPLLLLILSTLLFAKYTPQQINKDIEVLFNIVPRYEKVEIKGKLYNLDFKTLLQRTAMMESNYSTGGYKETHAKTYMQIEKQTGEYYMKISKERAELEKKIGRKLVWNKDRDAVFVAYLIYKAKLRAHRIWLDKYADKYFTNKDVLWLVHKILWNSLAGKATYSRWVNTYSKLKHFTK